MHTSLRCVCHYGLPNYEPLTGKYSVNVLPLPASLSTSMRPPLASTSFRLTASPSPMPLGLVVKSGSNSFFMFSGVMPVPVSLTLDPTHCSPLADT